MSKLEVNTIEPQCGTSLTLGASGDTITIPSGATITNAGTASGFGATGEVSWDTTVKTTGTFTATAGIGYFLNTTAGTITVNLPAGAAGSSVALADYAGTWQTNNVTVNPNGSEKIGGNAASVTLSTEGQSVSFVYIDGTQGWVNVLDSTSNVRGDTFVTATGGNAIVTCGNFKTHIFTGPGTFCVSSLSNCTPNNTVDYIVVAGGGGGGAQGGGAGAGGFRMSNDLCMPAPTTSPLANSSGITVTATGYPIAVGGGGTGSTAAPARGCAGSAASFSTITSAGGGGGSSDGYSPDKDGANGGSGGGGGWLPGPASNNYGTGNTPPVSPSQGNPGGSGYPQASSHGGGGGGGAGAPGCSGSAPKGGNGGAGSYIADGVIGPTAPSYGTPGPVSSTRYFAGGGGGNANPGNSGGGTGGVGGGGNGADPAGTVQNGTANTGGGAGSKHGVYSPPYTNANGGSGIVIIRYRYQ